MSKETLYKFYKEHTNSDINFCYDPDKKLWISLTQILTMLRNIHPALFDEVVDRIKEE